MLTDLDPVTAFFRCHGQCALHWAWARWPWGQRLNYAVLTDFQIWVCTLGMLLGRLEILSFHRPCDSRILAAVSKHLVDPGHKGKHCPKWVSITYN